MQVKILEMRLKNIYCHMSVESRNCEANRDGRCLGTDVARQCFSGRHVTT
jgi:hypothetical protein